MDPLCYLLSTRAFNLTSSTKPEVNNVLYCRGKRPRPPPPPQVTCIENFVKFVMHFWDMRAVRQTYWHTYTMFAILRNPPDGEVISGRKQELTHIVLKKVSPLFFEQLNENEWISIFLGAECWRNLTYVVMKLSATPKKYNRTTAQISFIWLKLYASLQNSYENSRRFCCMATTEFQAREATPRGLLKVTTFCVYSFHFSSLFWLFSALSVIQSTTMCWHSAHVSKGEPHLVKVKYF